MTQLSLDELSAADARALEGGDWLEGDFRPRRKDPRIAAKLFVANNPEAYGLIVKWAKRDADEGNRCAMHLYLALLRRYHWIRRGGSPYRVDNRLSSYLVEILLADYPELEPHFERRRKDARPQGGDATA